MSTRSERLAAQLPEHEVDLLLVSAPIDVRYLTGFTGSNGLAVIGADTRLFLTDFRYETQAAAQVAAEFEREIVTVDLLEAAVRWLEGETGAARGLGREATVRGLGREAAARRLAGEAGSRHLGFDDAAVTVKQHTRMHELLPTGWELAPCGGLVAALREVKDAHELKRIRAAAQLADEALRELLEQGIVGRTERDVAIELELRMRRLGAEGPSFPSIVAAGPHSALPHAEPRDVEIPPDTLVTIDWGAILEGYCSDCTRTFATGEGLGEQEREVYEVVRSAQATALAALRAGPSGRELDALARAVIEQAGYGERFGHGLGHGVGLEVHEPPRLSRTAGEQPLRAGNVVTIEPGVYIPERFGVRIEDLASVGESVMGGSEGGSVVGGSKGGSVVGGSKSATDSLSELPKELTFID
jgi:Xaa-Pro aminopeptidase